EAAFAELRRCAAVQFDAELVEHFIAVLLTRDTSRTPPTVVVAKQTALRIGMQIEKLAQALDARDLDSLAMMAGRLHTTADEQKTHAVAESVERLNFQRGVNRVWPDLFSLTLILLGFVGRRIAWMFERQAPRRSNPSLNGHERHGRMEPELAPLHCRRLKFWR